MGRRLASQPSGQPPAVVLGDLTLVRPLGWANVPVIAVSSDANDVTFRSRHVAGRCVVPGYKQAQRERTIEILCGLGAELHQRWGRRLPLFYGSDDQLEMIYQQRAALAAHFRFVLNDERRAWAMHDKGLFASLCEQSGVEVPRTVVPERTPALADALDALRPPLVLKPRTKSDWKAIQRGLFAHAAKAGIFADAVQLLAHPAFAELSDRLVVQEYIDAPVTNLYSFHGFVGRDGRLLAWFAGHKLRTYPEVAGESALLELVRDPQVESVGRDVARRLGLRGPFKIDLIRDPGSGALLTLEVNARFNLWHHLGAAHGVNLPLVAYDYLVHDRVPERPCDYQPRVRWMNMYRDLQTLGDQRGDKRLVAGARWLASLMSQPTIHEVFDWKDPAPFLAWLRGMAMARRPGGPRWLRTA